MPRCTVTAPRPCIARRRAGRCTHTRGAGPSDRGPSWLPARRGAALSRLVRGLVPAARRSHAQRHGVPLAGSTSCHKRGGPDSQCPDAAGAPCTASPRHMRAHVLQALRAREGRKRALLPGLQRGHLVHDVAELLNVAGGGLLA